MIDFKVPPQSRKNIREIAHAVRRQMDKGVPCFDIVNFLDVQLPKVRGFTDFWLEITDDQAELAGAHGYALPDECKIVLSGETYSGAINSNGRDRMTLAHEFGHLILHQNVDARFARTEQKLRAFESAEWQAKAFAGEFMVDHQYVSPRMSPSELVELFGVSYEAAAFQIGVFEKEGLI